MPIVNYPDWVKFNALKSPKNMLTFGVRDCELNETVAKHYSSSQQAFANLSTSYLIDSVNEFDFRRIFDDDDTRVSPEEISEMESFYMCLASKRFEIFLNTRSSEYQKDVIDNVIRLIAAQQKLPSNQDEVFTDAVFHLENMSYTESSEQVRTKTIFKGKDSRAAKYNKEGVELKLCDVVRVLGVEEDEIDKEILLGSIKIEDNDITHFMGCYRQRLIKDGNLEEKNLVNRRIERVDEITALAAKKAFLAEDTDEILKYTFVFSTLRGYNLRSTIGACWAHEMSARCILAIKDLPQFCKMPDVYLDVEAVSSGIFSADDPEHFSHFIEKQVRDYKNALEISVSNMLPSDSFFAKPIEIENPEVEFARYLVESRKYHEDDVAEIITYDFGEENAFQIAARNGDRNFFEVVQRNEFLGRSIIDKNFDWSKTLQIAENYSKNGWFQKWISKFYQSVTGDGYSRYEMIFSSDSGNNEESSEEDLTEERKSSQNKGLRLSNTSQLQEISGKERG